jgi:hypothetical protein
MVAEWLKKVNSRLNKEVCQFLCLTVQLIGGCFPFLLFFIKAECSTGEDGICYKREAPQERGFYLSIHREFDLEK